jgi:putative membrane protein
MDFPLLNASLNATSTVFLLAGLVAIKRGARHGHERLMYGAALVSALFLVSYLWYHFAVIPERGVTRYHGAGALRPLYYGLLLTHVVLAVVNVPLVIGTFVHARKAVARGGLEGGDFTRHKRWAKITFPVWLYVSVTGVLVYLFLYVWNPVAPAEGG